ncbi:hypothetical protein X777_00170, partial [Ooceraea biroi]
VVHEQVLHPFHHRKIQSLRSNDYPLRVAIVQWLLQKSVEQPEFHSKILFTDECCFTSQGLYNIHNSHIWAEKNPHFTYVHHHQIRFSVNVWAGIVGDVLVGPYLIPAQLTAQAYHVHLQDVLPELLETVPLAIRVDMWFLYDGVPACFTPSTRSSHRHLW